MVHAGSVGSAPGRGRIRRDHGGRTRTNPTRVQERWTASYLTSPDGLIPRAGGRPDHGLRHGSRWLLARVLRQGRGRAVKILYNALIRVSRDPVAADRAVPVRSGPAMARASSARLSATGRRCRDRGRNGGPEPVATAGRPARPPARDPAVVSGDRGRVGVEDGSLPDPVLPPAPGPRTARRRRRGATAAARTARQPTGGYAARGAKRRLVPPGRRGTAHGNHRAAGRKPAACPADRATRQRRGCVPGGPRR